MKLLERYRRKEREFYTGSSTGIWPNGEPDSVREAYDKKERERNNGTTATAAGTQTSADQTSTSEASQASTNTAPDH